MPRSSPCASATSTPGNDLPDLIEGTQYGTAWSKDDRYLFYTRPDDAWRSYQIWRHELATDAATDVLVFQEDDSHFDVGVDNTRNGQFVVINTESRTTSEVWLVDATDPLAPARLIAAAIPAWSTASTSRATGC